MESILSVAEMRRVDAVSNTPVDALMDAAGYAVATSAAAMGIGYGSVVRVLTGAGNNGGDGLVAARYLARRGATVIVHQLASPEENSPTGRALAAAHIGGVRFEPFAEPRPADLVVDALFGTGLRDELEDVVVPWTHSAMRVLAVDVPSGLDGDTGLVSGAGFTAERTVTFHALKTGHVVGDGPDRCGLVEVCDIGLEGGEPVMFRFGESDVATPVRARIAHKWSAGSVATIGGVPGLTGAAVLSARGALAAGAGVSTILTTEATARTYETLAPDVTSIQASESMTWRDHSSEVLALLDRFDALVVGPGLEPVSTVFVERIIEQFAGTVIADAGALKALARLDCFVNRDGPTVLTPHAGEFKRLTGDSPSPQAAGWLAETTGAVVVLKGNPTVVTGDLQIIVDSGGPELATIGTGDVLAGMIAAFVAGGIPTLEAASSAVYLHGVAGANLATMRTVSAPRLVDEVAVLMAQRSQSRS